MPEATFTTEWLDSLPSNTFYARKWRNLRVKMQDFNSVNNMGKVLHIGELENQQEAWSAMSAVHDEARKMKIKVRTRSREGADGAWSLFVMRIPDL